MGVLDILGFIETDGVPGDRAELFLVQMSQVVRSQHKIRVPGPGGKALSLMAIRSVMQPNVKGRREPSKLLLPIAKDGGRTDQQ
jgi:hypothetical protein